MGYTQPVDCHFCTKHHLTANLVFSFFTFVEYCWRCTLDDSAFHSFDTRTKSLKTSWQLNKICVNAVQLKCLETEMLSERVSELQTQRHSDSLVRLDSVLFFFSETWCSKMQKAGGDDSSCTLLHQQPQAARNRRQSPITRETLFTLQLLWHKHSPF